MPDPSTLHLHYSASLAGLPLELVRHILMHLTAREMWPCRLTCKPLRAVCLELVHHRLRRFFDTERWMVKLWAGVERPFVVSRPFALHPPTRLPRAPPRRLDSASTDTDDPPAVLHLLGQFSHLDPLTCSAFFELAGVTRGHPMTEIRVEVGGPRSLTLSRTKHQGFTAFMSFVAGSEGRLVNVFPMTRERVRFGVDSAPEREVMIWREGGSSRVWEAVFVVRDGSTGGEEAARWGPVRGVRRCGPGKEAPDSYVVEFEGVMCDTRWLLEKLARWSEVRQ